MVYFLKRLTPDRVNEINDRILAFHEASQKTESDPTDEKNDTMTLPAKAATEFGAKLDISQANGFVRIKRLSFDAFNESEDLVATVEHELTFAFVKAMGLGYLDQNLDAPPKNDTTNKQEEYQDNCDRIQVNRKFSLAKRCHGLGGSP